MSHSIKDRIEFTYKGNEVFLKVIEPSPDEKPLPYGKLTEYIQSKKFIDTDFINVKKAYKLAGGDPVRIAKRHTGLGYTSRFKLEISDDSLRCYLTLLPPRDEEVIIDPSFVMSELKSKNIIYGIKENEIRKAIDKKTFKTRIITAEGKYPSLGLDARLKTSVLCRMNLMDYCTEHSLDEIFNQFELINIVKAGDIIAEIEPATQGTPGITIFDDTVSTLKGETNIIQGLNIINEGNNVKAKIDGRVVLNFKGIDVEPVMIVEGVPERMIDFEGSIKILGGIETPCLIKASGDIEIHGMVSDTSLFAGRNIFIHGNLLGPTNRTIKADGDFAAYNVSNSNITAENTLISSTIFKSKISAYRSVVNTGPEGKIIGGQIRAGISVESKSIGSIKNIPTSISVATPEMLSKYGNKIIAPCISRIDNLKAKRDIILKKLQQIENWKNQSREMEATDYIILKNLLKRELSRNDRKTSDVGKDNFVNIKSYKPLIINGYITADRFYPETNLALGLGKRKVIELKERIRYCGKDSYMYSELLDAREL